MAVVSPGAAVESRSWCDHEGLVLLLLGSEVPPLVLVGCNGSCRGESFVHRTIEAVSTENLLVEHATASCEDV